MGNWESINCDQNGKINNLWLVFEVNANKLFYLAFDSTQRSVKLSFSNSVPGNKLDKNETIKNISKILVKQQTDQENTMFYHANIQRG